MFDQAFPRTHIPAHMCRGRNVWASLSNSAAHEKTSTKPDPRASTATLHRIWGRLGPELRTRRGRPAGPARTAHRHRSHTLRCGSL